MKQTIVASFNNETDAAETAKFYATEPDFRAWITGPVDMVNVSEAGDDLTGKGGGITTKWWTVLATQGAIAEA